MTNTNTAPRGYSGLVKYGGLQIYAYKFSSSQLKNYKTKINLSFPVTFGMEEFHQEVFSSWKRDFHLFTPLYITYPNETKTRINNIKVLEATMKSVFLATQFCNTWCNSCPSMLETK